MSSPVQYRGRPLGISGGFKPTTSSASKASTAPGAPSKARAVIGDGFDPPQAKPSNTQVVVKAGSSATAQAVPNVVYHGGKVLSTPTPTNIYWGKFWATPEGQANRTYNDAATADIVKSSYASVWAQYGVGPGAFGGSVMLDAEPPPSVNRQAIEAVIQQAIASGSISKNPEGIYTVILPPGTVLDAGDGATSLTGLGGFHGSYADPVTHKSVYYAAIAYSQPGNGVDVNGNPRDNLTITESHEWTEAATDPDTKFGWYDLTNGEIGDLAMSSLPLNQSFDRVDGYAVQKEWSNVDQAFEIQARNPGPVTRPALKPLDMLKELFGFLKTTRGGIK